MSSRPDLHCDKCNSYIGVMDWMLQEKEVFDIEGYKVYLYGECKARATYFHDYTEYKKYKGVKK